MLHILDVFFLFVSHAAPAERRLVADKRTAGGLNLASNFEDQNIFVQGYPCFRSLAKNCEDQNIFVQEYSCFRRLANNCEDQNMFVQEYSCITQICPQALPPFPELLTKIFNLRSSLACTTMRIRIFVRIYLC